MLTPGDTVIIFMLAAVIFLVRDFFEKTTHILRRLHPKRQDMQLYGIKMYLNSTEGRQASASDQSKEVLRIISGETAEPSTKT